VSEWEFYKELAKDIQKEYLNPNIKLRVFFRSEHGNGYTQKMKMLHREIDKWGADISISLHFNASSHASANGHEVLYYKKSKKSGKYAELMNDIFTKNLPNRNRGVKPKSKSDRGGGFLSKGRSNCILVEPFFASHQNEYSQGQEGRAALIRSFTEFFDSVG
jgi:N-acetylmuramoyl-L-alanine amidase